MSPTIGVIYLFIKIVRGKLVGFTASNVDDTISAGDDGFGRERNLTERMFKYSARE